MEGLALSKGGEASCDQTADCVAVFRSEEKDRSDKKHTNRGGHGQIAWARRCEDEFANGAGRRLKGRR